MMRPFQSADEAIEFATKYAPGAPVGVVLSIPFAFKAYDLCVDIDVEQVVSWSHCKKEYRNYCCPECERQRT